eukprot:EC826560.1.p1 GENE.EC826560.1~~EC826560.1.p1  ORF type:complete len:111 (+),score=45.30 EC826560.1:18-350(+)
MENYKDIIKKEVIDNNVVIFSKSYCPYCKKVKELFQKINVEFKSWELDLLGKEGEERQKSLVELTKQKTVPNVWIKGKFIGGCDKVHELYEIKKLQNILKEGNIKFEDKE